jgi:quinol monooxygenase YgiN
MTDAVTVTFEVCLPAEAADGFSNMGAAMLEGTRTFPGFREVRIVQHKDDPGRFLFIEQWDSEQAYHDYIAWRTERGELQALRQMATRVETNIWPRTIVAV